MSDIYKIGVAIMLTDGLSPALSMLSHRLLGVHRSVQQINSGIGQWRTALIGAAGIMGGTMMFGALAKISTYGDKFIDQQAKLKLLGLSNQQVAEATAKAWSNTRSAPGSAVDKNLKDIGEMYSIVGFDEALKMSTKLAQVNQVLKQVTGKEGAGFTIARAGELMGTFTNKVTGKFDDKGYDKFLDLVSRSAIATHGKVTPAEWLAYAKQAGPASANLDENGFLTTTAVMQAMGGFRAGTAAAALNRQFAGGIMSQRVAKELERVGVAKQGDFGIGKGGQVIAKSGSMQGLVSRLQKDPLDAIVGVLLPALEKKGFNTNEKLSSEIYRIIGTGPAQREVYELIRGRYQIEQERERAKQSLGIGGSMGVLNAESPIAVKANFIAAWDNLMTAIGSEGTRAAIPMMNQLASAFNEVAKVVVSNPAVMSDLFYGISAMAVALTGGGIIAVLAALGPVGWFTLGIIGIIAGVTAIKAVLDAQKTIPMPSLVGDAASGVAHGKLGYPGHRPPVSGNATDSAWKYKWDNPLDWEAAPASKSTVNAPPTKIILQVDGRAIGEIAAVYMTKGANGPLQGSNYFDPSSAQVPVDYKVAH